MELKNLAGAIIGVVIAVMLVAVILLPVLNDATTVADTYTNEGYYRVAAVDEGTEMTVSWDYTKPTVLTVNSVEVPLPDKEHMSTIPFTIFCSHTWYLRYAYDNTDGYYVGMYQNSNITTYGGNVTAERSLTVTVTADGTTTVNNGTEHTWSAASGGFYVISETGDYVMKKMDKDAYVNGDSTIFGYGRTYARSYNYTSELSGTVDDGITGAFYPESTISTAGWTISDVTLNSTKDTSHTDLYKVSTMTYEITGDGIVPYTAVFSQYIVPYEVTSERSVHPDAATSSLLSMIPVLIVAGLVIGVVGIFYLRRE